MASGDREEIRVVLVGKTGKGKSALGNSLLQSESYFHSSSTGESVTSKCSIGHLNMQNGKRLVVVDTPGLFDNRVSIAETSKELIRCVALACPGPHAFLFVLSIDRFTKEELDTVEHLTKLFGEDVMKFVIVVFNHKDSLEYEKKTLKEHIESSPDVLQKLISRCDGRTTAINNRVPIGSNEDDINAILRLVEQTTLSNRSKYYTEKMFEAAEEVFQNRVKEIEAEWTRKGIKLTEYEMREKVQKEIEENDGILTTFAKGIEKTLVKSRETLRDAWNWVTSGFK